MITNPQISVVVPIFSETRDLAKITSWVFSDPAKNLEIILVIDSPSGKVSSEVEKLRSKAINQRIQVIEVEYGSPGMSRNAGIKNSNGQWICFWDCDDSPNVLEFKKMINEATNRESSIAIGDFEIVRNERILKRKLSHSPRSKKYLYGQIALAPGLWRFAFRKNSISNIGFPTFRMGEDQAFLAEVLNSTNSPYLHGTSVYKYYSGSSDQLTSNKQAILDIEKSLNNLASLRKTGVAVDILIPMYLTQSWTLIKQSKWKKRFGLTTECLHFLGFRIDILFSLTLIFGLTFLQNQRVSN